MAALVHGLAVVTNAGHLTEPLWAETGAAAVATPPDEVARLVETLLADGRQRERLGAAGRALYESRIRAREDCGSPLRARIP